VTVDPDAPFLRETSRLHTEQPTLACYQVIEWLSRRTTLSSHSPAQLRRAAARQLLEGTE
jgi:hypothetical protein